MTPGTRKSQAGGEAPSSPARSMNGSVKPPMQASTWQLTPWSAAMAAMSATGSMTPWGYCGAEATSRTVSSSPALAMASGSALKSRADVDAALLEAEVVAGLGEGGVGRGGQHDVPALDPALLALQLGGEHGEHERLGAAAGEEAREAVAHVVAGVDGAARQQPRAPGDDVVGHGPQARERRRG